MNQPVSPETQRADRLERYLAGLEQGNVFSLAQENLSPEEIDLLKFARHLKVTTKAAQPSLKLLERSQPENKTQAWRWLFSIPAVGVAAAVALFVFSQKPLTLTNNNVSVAIDVDSELAQLDELSAQLESSNQQLAAEIEEIDFYLEEDGLEQL